MVGKTYNFLTCVKYAGKKGKAHAFEFECVCGTRKVLRGSEVRNGLTTSCGCKRREQCSEVGKSARTHGLSRHRVNTIFSGIKQRCENPNCVSYKNYGAKGVTLHPSISTLETFIDCVGMPPSDEHTIDRFPKSNGNYEPGNIRWATYEQQGNNTTRCLSETKRMMIVDLYHTGFSVKEICEITNTSKATVTNRINRDAKR